MNNKTQYSILPLFCKPLHYPGITIFSRYLPLIGKELSFRSFNLTTDLDLIHSWVNMAYTQAFWRLAYTKEQLYDLYYSIQRNSNGHSYLGLLDGQPICQWDVYRVLADEIRTHIPGASDNDCGFHLLMAPNEKPIPGLSISIVGAWLDYYFSFPEAEIMYAEPDILNDRSNRILRRRGFRFDREIQMSYKTANLYSITKQQFMNSANYFINNQQVQTSQSSAFFKPVEGDKILFKTFDNSLQTDISFRSLNLVTDLTTIHSWVNQPYSAKYWQLQVGPGELRNIYKDMLENPLTHSFIGMLNDRIVCQVDLYHVSTEEIKDHVDNADGHCGFHILMLPPKESLKGLTEAMLRAFVQFFFSFSNAMVLYGEPDENNTSANLAATRAGFQLQKTIQLSYKTANLYCITKEQFHATYQKP